VFKSIAAGAFGRRKCVCVSYPPQIAVVFNQTIAYEARIAAEVARLSATVGKEGRLKQRMPLPGSLGG